MYDASLTGQGWPPRARTPTGPPRRFPFGERSGGALMHTRHIAKDGACDATEVLSRARITKLPSGFDGAALMRDLDSLLLRHTITEVGENRGATIADATRLKDIRARTRILIREIHSVLTDKARMPAHHA